jgi:hypothetical protein
MHCISCMVKNFVMSHIVEDFCTELPVCKLKFVGIFLLCIVVVVDRPDPDTKLDPN